MGIIQRPTISDPCTPDPLRFGAYSERSTDRSHSMTRWLVQYTTSFGESIFLFCGKSADEYSSFAEISLFESPGTPDERRLRQVGSKLHVRST